MKPPIHYAEAFERIGVRGVTVSRTETYRILCGATEGEADTRKRPVTCPECRERLTALRVKT